MANLAFGALGILCYWLRSAFWTAIVIAASVWLLGNAAGHIEQIIVAQNYQPNNAGAALYSDIVVPLLIIALLVYYRYAGEGEREPARVR